MTVKVPLTAHPTPSFRLGQTTIPRFSGGWMHQFGHIYALQREMSKPTNSWFRAMELWHVARSEGVPYSSYNYAHILQMCNRDTQWSQAMKICTQMHREGISLETDCAQHILAACVRSGQWEMTLQFFAEMRRRGIQLNELCVLSVVIATRSQCAENGDSPGAACETALQALASARLTSLSNVLHTEVTKLLAALPLDCPRADELAAYVPVCKRLSDDSQSMRLNLPEW
ncbi:hypothetical protein XU18_2882 [Perkinsela sp. CCAP 1560/4]|nr:hypothetical protein XU18_2882 [Perkinsela sp. CCAP 1560/4]|eukprot:KNH06377.1 hypothetical protein XU18_2882 [Perkinsela sp. CCAP 1560/4]